MGLTRLLEASLISNVSISHWGGTVVVSCLYLPVASRPPYQLTFHECRERSWEVYGPQLHDEPAADILGFAIGAGNHQQPAVSATDIFELSVLYGSLELAKSW